MGSYRLLSRATDDLAQIWRYGNLNWGLQRANSFYNALLEKIQEIADYPNRYPKADDIGKDCRRCVYKGYSIYYRIEYSGVAILAVVRGQSLANRYWTTYQK